MKHIYLILRPGSGSFPAGQKFLRLIAFLSVSALLGILCSCQHTEEGSQTTSPIAATGTNKSAQDSVKDFKARILEIHDFAMGKIGPVRRAVEQLNKSKRKSPPRDTAGLNTLIAVLKTDDSLMFAWMDQFNLDSDTAYPSARALYLDQQLKQVNRLKDQMVLHLEQASLKNH